MPEIVIQASGISKMYSRGTIGTGSLRKDMHRIWHTKILGKPDPFFFQNGEKEINDNSDRFWALKDIDFEIRRGETWGIIGDNGAGKSTLLKILSRIIKPTSGVIRGSGKVCSLLEVGTGFHPDLTGMENIFLSGHLMGMTAREIKGKLDAIIDFAGIGNFIETPVKRYSSGMYVRLAFAVAAHLEPDILIVDEVLAVGDMDFQKKCLGKMNEAASQSGRTVLFVSHNLQAINNLCRNTMLLNKGQLKDIGETKKVLMRYISGNQDKSQIRVFEKDDSSAGNNAVQLISVEIIPDLPNEDSPIDVRTSLNIRYRFFHKGQNVSLSTDLLLFTNTGECIFDIASQPRLLNEGLIEAECTIPGKFLNDGSYYISLYFIKDTSTTLFSLDQCLNFDVADYRENINWYEKWWGVVRPDFPLTMKAVLQDDCVNVAAI